MSEQTKPEALTAEQMEACFKAFKNVTTVLDALPDRESQMRVILASQIVLGLEMTEQELLSAARGAGLLKR